MKNNFEAQFVPYEATKQVRNGTALILALHSDDEVIGCGEPNFWGIKDRTLEYNEKYIQMVSEQIDKLNPLSVYSPSVYEMHPDHKALALQTIEAIRRSKNTPDLYMYEIGRAMLSLNYLLDIIDLWETKMSGINCFGSQMKI
ncbi:MAG: hypothetical protein H8E61_04305 [Bacteroidetes bacterium]|nr:hypothetical protein [Bacteroidota bacterium]